jgi:hypothetical protein
MNLRELLEKINREVKANPKVLSFEVRIDQYEKCDANGTVPADIFTVHPALYRGDESVVCIG